MPDTPAPSAISRALAIPTQRVLLHSPQEVRSVASARSKVWYPPDDYMRPEQARSVIAAATNDRDRLLLRVLWATGGRVSEARTLRAIDVRRDALDLPNLKNPSRPVKRVYLSAADADLPGALLVWQREKNLDPAAPLFLSRKAGPDGRVRAIGRQEINRIVAAAGARAGVTLKSVRDSGTRRKGDPGPVYPHAFRHARVRQNLRATKSLPIVQKQAGWSRLQQVYLIPDDQEVADAMQGVSE